MVLAGRPYLTTWPHLATWGWGWSIDWPKGIPRGQSAIWPLSFHVGSLQGELDCWQPYSQLS